MNRFYLALIYLPVTALAAYFDVRYAGLILGSGILLQLLDISNSRAADHERRPTVRDIRGAVENGYVTDDVNIDDSAHGCYCGEDTHGFPENRKNRREESFRETGRLGSGRMDKYHEERRNFHGEGQGQRPSGVRDRNFAEEDYGRRIKRRPHKSAERFQKVG